MNRKICIYAVLNLASYKKGSFYIWPDGYTYSRKAYLYANLHKSLFLLLVGPPQIGPVNLGALFAP